MSREDRKGSLVRRLPDSQAGGITSDCGCRSQPLQTPNAWPTTAAGHISVITSPIFGQAISLPVGPGSGLYSNRRIELQANFSF
jgi:hypothetical protein